MTYSIHPTLVRAYRETIYKIDAQNHPILMSVGHVSSETAQVMREAGVITAAFITACNPHSTPGDPSVWMDEQNNLAADIKSMDFATIDGQGHDGTGVWPPEPSLLILGISLSQAELLARRYGQNGFIWLGSPVALPALKLMHPVLVPEEDELEAWRSALPKDQSDAATPLTRREQALLMAVPENQLRHWLLPDQWKLDQPWPLARPEGGAMGIGTELDRIFKLIAAGLIPALTEFAERLR